MKLARLPPWLIAGLGLVMPVMREIGEMAYQWEEPFVVDDARFRARFGAHAQVTPLEVGARATVEWARRAFAAKAA